MTIVPAIDLRGGSCVRLLRGDPDAETKYDADPAARARAFVAAGARALHVVDLDAAFGTGGNHAALRAICAAVDVPVQTGGGVRTQADIQTRLDAGASAVVLGTILATEPVHARALCERFGDRLVAGIDARGREVAVHGWRSAGAIERDEFVETIAGYGFTRIVFTEIARDGAGTGFDVAALTQVAALVPNVKITASGGAKTVDHLLELVATTPANVDRAIVGRAFYEGTLDLPDAMSAVAAALRSRDGSSAR